MSVPKNIETFLEYLGDAIALVNSNSKIEFANRACLELFGFQREEFIGQSINIVIESEHTEKHAHLVKQFIQTRAEPRRMMSRSALKCLTKSGYKFIARISISTMEINACSYGIAIIQDFSTQQKMVDDIKHKSNTDPLTMLYNRHYLEKVTLSDNRWLTSHHSVAVLYIDFDRFKPLNDLYGHAFGDFILKSVALRMKETLRQDDLIFRMGGDEFVVLLALDNKSDPLKTAKDIAKNLYQEISRSIRFEDSEVSIGASIGLGLYPNDFDDIEILIKLADKAMYHSKKQKQLITCVSELPKTL
mgnify:CR=1 FL=1